MDAENRVHGTMRWPAKSEVVAFVSLTMARPSPARALWGYVVCVLWH